MTSWSWARTAAIFIRVAADAARPPHLRDGGGRPHPAAGAVRLRHQRTDPKGGLPTAIVAPVASDLSRSLAAALQNSGYFRLVATDLGERGPMKRLLRGELQFVVQIPDDFARRVLRGEQLAILVAADATDPSAGGNAIAALRAHRRRGAGPRPRPRAGRGGHGRAALRAGRAPALQPRGPVALQHRAGLGGHHPDHDHGDAHLAGADARA